MKNVPILKGIIKEKDFNSVLSSLEKNFIYVIRDNEEDEEDPQSCCLKFNRKTKKIELINKITKKDKTNLNIQYVNNDWIDYKLDPVILEKTFRILSYRSLTSKLLLKKYNEMVENDWNSLYRNLARGTNIRVLYYIDDIFCDSCKNAYDNCILGRKNDYYYGFLHGKFVSKVNKKDATKLGFVNIDLDSDGELTYNKLIYFTSNSCIYGFTLHGSIMRYILKNSMKEGDNLDRFIDVYNESAFRRYWLHTNFKTIDLVIGKIEKPIISRYPENDNEDTFDYIQMIVNISYLGSSDERNKQVNFLKKYIPKITKEVYEKLGKDQRFKKFNVPVNLLEVTKCTFTNDKRLFYIFEIKKDVEKILSGYEGENR